LGAGKTCFYVASLAAVSVGIVDKKKMIDGSTIQEGDIVIGLASTNPALSTSAKRSADKLNSLNFTFFFFLKVVRSHPIALSLYFSFHDVFSYLL